MRSQNFVKTAHIWIGLLFGAFICITCLSGSIIVFRQEIEDAMTPKIWPAQQHANLDAAVARALAANPDGRLTRVSLERDSYLLTLESGGKRSERIIVDAGTGQAVGNIESPWLDFVSDLHHNLLFGKLGRRIQGGIGAVLFVLSATGVLLFFMRKPSWRSATTVNSSPPRRVHLDLHRVTGVWVYAFLALLAATGFALGYPEMLGKAPAVPKQKQAAGKSFRPLEEYMAAARAAVPAAEFSEIRLPKSTKDPVSIRYYLAGDLGSVGRNEIAMNASTAQVLAIRDASGLPPGARVQHAVMPIHYAEFGGLAIKILWSLAGIMPTVLFVTGLLLWFRKKVPNMTESADKRELMASFRA
jgi:uncharacterized iron-regulated membrane protein